MMIRCRNAQIEGIECKEKQSSYAEIDRSADNARRD
jgi:hypothetical protein